MGYELTRAVAGLNAHMHKLKLAEEKLAALSAKRDKPEELHMIHKAGIKKEQALAAANKSLDYFKQAHETAKEKALERYEQTLRTSEQSLNEALARHTLALQAADSEYEVTFKKQKTKLDDEYTQLQMRVYTLRTGVANAEAKLAVIQS
jgi:phage-related minor tail protein